MEVLLINPPERFDESNENLKKNKGYSLYPPLGLAYLASMLEKNDIDVRIFDIMATNNSLAEIISLIENESPSVVGITSTTPQIRGAVQLAKTLKRTFQDEVRTALGGAHITADPDFFNRFNYFDFAVTGEGEITFTDLIIKSLKKEEVNGVFTGVQYSNLDEIPFPARHLYDQDSYYLPIYGNKFATIHTTRGCPFNCNFCSKPITGRSVRFRSPQNVVNEIEYLVNEKKIKYVLFTDDTFSINKKRVKEICNELMKRDIRISWSCETRANLVDESLLKIMHKAGCGEIDFGIETGNEELRLNVIKKGISNKHIQNAFSLCKKFNIQTGAFVMLGFPSENMESMLETLNFCKKIEPDTIGLHLTVPMPGSQIYQQAINEKKLSKNYWDDYARGKETQQPIYVPDGFTRQELERIQKQFYRQYYLRPRYILGRSLFYLKNPQRAGNEIKAGLSVLLKGRTETGRP